jgi:hypothetical protein
MTNVSTPVSKSQGQTPTEKYLVQLCDRTFLKLWSYPNPFRSEGKELCDLLAVFEDHIFLFFDRESRRFESPNAELELAWKRWEKETVQKQIATANGAERHLLQEPGQVYLDSTCTVPFPLKIPTNSPRIHKIIVAHGAAEACKAFSPQNLSGSLAVCYGMTDVSHDFPFSISLDKEKPVHVLDSHTLGIVLGELDTFYDFSAYLNEKEYAIKRYDALSYTGEEDLLAYYFLNFDRKRNAHAIWTKDKRVNLLMVDQGFWNSFQASEPYRRKKEADRVSRLWDDLLQRTSENALAGTLSGDGDVFNARSAIHEMAKEPRFARRALAEAIRSAIANFPEGPLADGEFVRNPSFMPSFYLNKGYVFLQIRRQETEDFEEYRRHRIAVLAVACGAAKNKMPHLKKVIGIAIDAPKFATTNAEDFVLLNCENWTEDEARRYREANVQLRFFRTPNLKQEVKRIQNFPGSPKPSVRPRSKEIRRNDTCPCGSGRKFKKCHGAGA